MTEASEQSFSGSVSTENSNALRGSTARFRPSAPLWRFPAGLKPTLVVRSLKTKILPRIVLALKPSPAAADADDGAAVDPVITFAAMTLSADDRAASDFIDGLLAQGVTVEAVFLDWLAPAARRLGDQWESDETDFANVTLGVGRLHMIMRRLGDAFCNDQSHAEGGESALLTNIPGEQHSFGLSMVAEFFRRAGWNLCTGPFASHRELTSLVHNHWFDVVGFSVSSDRRLDELRRDIDNIRSGSRNPRIGVMLGGPMLLSHPELVASVGADMMSVDAMQAPAQARGLIDQMKADPAR
jgi:methanogenic corrinoid protein MtbC1